MKKIVFGFIIGLIILLAILLTTTSFIEVEVPNFWVFLVAYIIYIITTGIWQKIAQGEPNSIIIQLLQVVISIFGMFVLVWSLSGFFDIRLVGLFLLIASIGIILIKPILKLFLLTTSSELEIQNQQRVKAWAMEMGKKHSFMGCSLIIFSLLVTLLYPFFMWHIFNSYPIASTQATLAIFKWTLSWFFITGLIIIIPIVLAQLLSKTLDENTRTQTLINLLGGIFQFTFYLAVMFWAFGFAGTGYSVSVGTVSLSISPLLVGILMLFLILGYLVPYIMGWKRATKWRQDLLQKQQDWIQNILNILEYPDPSIYTPKLKEFKEQLENNIFQYGESDEIVKLLLKDKKELNENERILVSEFQKVQHLDSRFNYVLSLVNLYKETEEMLKLLSGDQSDTDKLIKAGCYSNKYRYRKDDVAQNIIKEKQTVPKLVAGMGIVFATIITVVVSKLGEEVLEILRTYVGV